MYRIQLANFIVNFACKKFDKKAARKVSEQTNGESMMAIIIIISIINDG